MVQVVYCSNCGKALQIPDELQSDDFLQCTFCGYDFENPLTKSKKSPLVSNTVNISERKWYDEKWLVFLLCLFIFPIGLYALWKSNTISKNWKIIWTIIILLGVVFYFMHQDEFSYSSQSSGGNTDISHPTSDYDSKPVIDILQHKATYEPYTNSYTVHCRVKNNSDRLITYMDMTATFYDKHGSIVGTGMGNAANIAAGAEKTVDVMAIDIDNAAKYEVQVDNVMY